MQLKCPILSPELDSEIEKLYNKIIEGPLKVYEIFKEFYGENFVDFQGAKTLEDFKLYLVKSVLYVLKHEITVDPCDKEYIQYEDSTETIIESLNKFNTYNTITNNTIGNSYILVYFPKVRVTNEYDHFVDISKFFAKISLTTDGRLKDSPRFNRSEYTQAQILSSYMHSHLNGIDFYNLSTFRYGCLGTGPIVQTCNNLKREFNENLWELFCFELKNYVETESVAGTPYMHLERIGNSEGGVPLHDFCVINKVLNCRLLNSEDRRDFLEYLLNKKVLKFNYYNSSFGIGMSYSQYMLCISNVFIEWYNKQYNDKKISFSFSRLKDEGFIYEGYISENKIIIPDNRRSINNYKQYIGIKICTFKGKDYTFNITNIKEESKNTLYFINDKFALWILTSILKVLNFRYGRKSSESSGDSTEIEPEVIYL
jgi:hypothetical protein